jgi:hypothetical protein
MVLFRLPFQCFYGTKKLRGFRARQRCAEQDNPGKGPFGSKQTSKGDIAMVKTLGKAESCAALVVLGWISFFGGLLVSTSYPFLKISLLALARVLP